MQHTGLFLIRFLHISLILFMIATPLHRKSPSLLLILHLHIGLLMVLHWVTNSDGCILTVIETAIRGVPLSNSFVHSLVSPIYSIDDETVRTVVTWGTIALMGISGKRVYNAFQQKSPSLELLESPAPPFF